MRSYKSMTTTLHQQITPLAQAIEDLRQRNLQCRVCGEYDEIIKNKGKKNQRSDFVPKVKISAKNVTRLTESRTAPVPIKVVDYTKIKYLFIGEAPGADEDKAGEGFVGRSGRELRYNLIRNVAKLDINECAFSNVVKCHPLNNRDPYKGEIAACLHWTEEEIDLIQPEAIFTVGKFATQALLGEAISSSHGNVYAYKGIPTIPLYHPAGKNRAVAPDVLEEDYKNIRAKLAEWRGIQSGKVKTPRKMLIRTQADLEGLTEHMRLKALEAIKSKQKYHFGFDIETNESLLDTKGNHVVDPVTNELAGIAFYFPDYYNEETSIYLPLCTHKDKLVQPQDLGVDSWEMVIAKIAGRLQSLFNNGVPYIHNAKFEMESLDKYGFVFKQVHDTQLMAYILRLAEVGLKSVTHNQYGVEQTELTALYDVKKEQFRDSSLSQAHLYACDDAYWCFRFGQDALAKITQDDMLESYQIRLDLLPWIAEEELEGIDIDEDKRLELKPLFDNKMAELQQKVYELAGEEFNIKSVPDKNRILFDKLGLPKTVELPSGYYSTDKGHLQALEYAHAIITPMLECSSMGTVLSTFIDGVPKRVHPETGKLHASINQTVTDTGRLSVSNPNWQNQPVRLEEYKRIRELVYAPVGWVLWAIDQAQIEVRYAAHISRDPKMIEILMSGQSYHGETCKSIYQIEEEDRDWPALYKRTKNGNFCVQYEGSPYKLQETLGIPLREAQYFFMHHHNLYETYWEWATRYKELCRKRGYTETILGFRRYIPEIRSTNGVMRSKGERFAINVPIQGSSAEHIQKAMSAVYKRLKEGRYESRMMLQVHDELVGISPVYELDEVVQLVAHELETAMKLLVPTPVDIEVGPSWGEVKEYEVWKEMNPSLVEMMGS